MDSPDGRLTLFCVEVPEPKTGKLRMHLDIRVNIREHVDRLRSLGARVVERRPEWTVMATLLGYTPVAPGRHVVDVTGDRPLFRHLTDVVHDVAEALRPVVPTGRVYVLSLGSHQGNAHVHWHVAPLPPGVPYERQQFRALMAENGVLDIPPAEQAALARRIAGAVAVQRAGGRGV